MARYTHDNTPGYTDAGIASLNKAHATIVKDRGYDMAILPQDVAAEIDRNIRLQLINTHRKNLTARDLLRVYGTE